MNLLKRLFGGGGGMQQGAMLFYVRSRRSGEIIELRLDMNQLTPEYENERVSGYFAHKTLVGQRSFERLEADFHFDPGKRLQEKSVTGGEFVTREDYIAQQEGEGNG
ncbi:MAG: hypothetical protein JXN59_02770 [Anaerolineae bacterium]|nr:hypothetical protein [Anaerolineae bacterium]